MITIGRPYIEEREGGAFLIASVKDDVRQREMEVWYSVNKEYGGYLCDKLADAFLLLVLQLGMSTGQDIKVEAPVSARLLFNLENTVQPLFAKALPGFRHIKIEAAAETETLYKGMGVGCCCSLGVDSFSSFLKHFSSDVIEGYRVTHLTLFNSGQLGYEDIAGAENKFYETVRSLKPFADEVGLPIVAVNSNLNSLFLDSGLTILHTFVNRTLSCAMALQPLFGKYVFSSSYSVEQFEMSEVDESHMESAYVPLFSTNNMEIILSNPGMTRVEKTKFLSQFPITTKYLDVCWASQMAYGKWKDAGLKLLEGKTKRNCGRCNKCLRTMFTLDLLGRLEAYEGQFHTEYYKAHKDEYMAKVLVNKGDNIFYEELKELISSTGYKPSSKVRHKIFFIKHPYIEKVYKKTRKVIKRLSKKINA